jgi:hypothetical protein
VRTMVDEVLRALSPQFDRMYASEGRPSIAPEKLLRAQLLQMLYSVRSERLLMEEIDYSMLFRWFVGVNLDEEVWDATVFSKNRDPVLNSGPSERKYSCAGVAKGVYSVRHWGAKTDIPNDHTRLHSALDYVSPKNAFQLFHSYDDYEIHSLIGYGF